MRLLNLLGDILPIAPEDSNGYTPEMLTELEKEDIEILEELLGRRVDKGNSTLSRARYNRIL